MERFDQSLDHRPISLLRKNSLNLSPDVNARVIHNMALNSMRYGARDYIEGLQIWSQMDDSWGYFFSKSIGGVDEELINPLDPTFQETEQSWWNKLENDGDYCFVFRPFNQSPYIGLTGKWRKNYETIFFSNVRLYYSNFRDPKAEFIMGIPVFDGLSLTLGTSYTYHVDGSREPVCGSLRLQHTLAKNNQASFWFVGIEAGEAQRLIAGLSHQF